jgi:hypothetical protein
MVVHSLIIEIKIPEYIVFKAEITRSIFK